MACLQLQIRVTHPLQLLEPVAQVTLQNSVCHLQIVMPPSTTDMAVWSLPLAKCDRWRRAWS